MRRQRVKVPPLSGGGQSERSARVLNRRGDGAHLVWVRAENASWCPAGGVLFSCLSNLLVCSGFVVLWVFSFIFFFRFFFSVFLAFPATVPNVYISPLGRSPTRSTSVFLKYSMGCSSGNGHKNIEVTVDHGGCAAVHFPSLHKFLCTLGAFHTPL